MILFLGSQTISLFGSSLVQFAIMWYITLQTKSGVMMTIYIICSLIPTFLLSPFGGILADPTTS
jgi:DHA3 family macrolide efflux protein-like MFS transporter